MPKNKLHDLRDLMFETIERLMDDDDGAMDTKKAKAIADVGRLVVESARVEVEILRAVKNTPLKSNFIEIPNTLNGTKLLAEAGNAEAEIPDCKCGEPIFPDAYEQSIRLELNYPRCRECLTLFPKHSNDLNGGGK